MSEPASCPRTGRARALPGRLPSGAIRPSDVLTAFFAVAVAWMLAGAAAAAVYAAGGPYEARWLALHLIFVGGISQLVVGAGQFFACAFLATDPPSKRMVRAQLAVWSAATLAIAAGVPTGMTAATGAGGVLVLAGLALFARELVAMRRRSIQRAPWATRWYLAAAAFLAAGACLGPLMAAGVAWPHGSLLGAHLTLNLGGWFGTAIVGTLHTFYPSLTQTRLAHPRLQSPTFALWSAGITTLAAGAATGTTVVAAAGWALLAAAALLLGTNVARSLLGARRHAAPGIVVTAGQVALVAATLAGLAVTVAGDATAALTGPQRDAVALLVVPGWIGLTVAGSLLRLLGLMARVRLGIRRTAPPPREAPALAASLLVAAGVAIAASGATAGIALVAAGYAAIAIRVAVLAVSAVRAAPLRV